MARVLKVYTKRMEKRVTYLKWQDNKLKIFLIVPVGLIYLFMIYVVYSNLPLESQVEEPIKREFSQLASFPGAIKISYDVFHKSGQALINKD